MVIEKKDKVGTICNVHFDNKAEMLINSSLTDWPVVFSVITILAGIGLFMAF